MWSCKPDEKDFITNSLFEFVVYNFFLTSTTAEAQTIANAERTAAIPNGEKIFARNETLSISIAWFEKLGT